MTDAHDLEPIGSIMHRVFAEIVQTYTAEVDRARYGHDPHHDNYLDQLADTHEDEANADQDIPF